jgi:hypothetical protein
MHVGPKHCYLFDASDGGIGFMCGDLGPHCAHCMRVGANLCDYPVGEGVTCDQSLCEIHVHNIGTELDYCPAHYERWRKFKHRRRTSRAIKE